MVERIQSIFYLEMRNALNNKQTVMKVLWCEIDDSKLILKEELDYFPNYMLKKI